MQPGKILIEWGHDGKLSIKCSLPVNDSEGRKLAIRALLDATKALNETGQHLVTSGAGFGARILGGN